MRHLLMCATLALACSGCATPRPGVGVEYQTVAVEVMRPCPGDAPTRPEPLGALPDDARDAARALVAKLAEYAAPGGYADRLEADLAICRRAEGG